RVIVEKQAQAIGTAIIHLLESEFDFLPGHYMTAPWAPDHTPQRAGTATFPATFAPRTSEGTSQILNRVESFPAAAQRVSAPKGRKPGYPNSPDQAGWRQSPAGVASINTRFRKVPAKLPANRGIRSAPSAIRIGAVPPRSCREAPASGDARGRRLMAVTSARSANAVRCPTCPLPGGAP